MQKIGKLLSVENLDKLANYSFVLYGFLLPLSRAAISFFSILIFAIWIQKLIRVKDFSIFKEKAIIFFYLFLIFSAISLFWANPKYFGFGADILRKYMYLWALPAYAAIIDKKYAKMALNAFIWGVFVSSLISYGVFFEIIHLHGVAPQNPSPVMHHIVYSIFLAFAASLLLYKILNYKKNRILHTIMFALIVGDLFLINGRTGQVTFIFAMLLVIYLRYRFTIKTILLSAALLFSILFAAYHLSENFHNRVKLTIHNTIDAIENENYYESVGQRIGTWFITKEMLKDHLLLGYGIGSEMPAFYKYTKTDPKYRFYKELGFPHMHNQYLQIILQIGLIGLLIFLAFIYFIYKAPTEDREIRDVKYIILTIYLLGFLTEPLISHRNFSMGLFAFVIGIVLVFSKREKKIAG
ncbi:MAG: O-antigen ligase family protein [Epsilonproteobacteria bacterium]|nr:O-antigen ligase family protein [Campylobacterota bacterium]